jgi:uncharacterized protein (TIGR02145 family)
MVQIGVALALVLGVLPSLLRAQPPRKEIVIGEQIWMTENLSVVRFANGDLIPEMRSDSLWEANQHVGRPAWVAFKNDPARIATFGRLYNFFAVADPRGLCPTGWRVPSIVDWQILVDRLGGTGWAARRLKTRGWGGDLSVGFGALPGYARHGVGAFPIVRPGKDEGYWWSSTTTSNDAAFHLHLEARDPAIYLYTIGQGEGMSVRCMKDVPAPTTPTPAEAAPSVASRSVTPAGRATGLLTDPRDGQVYRTVRIAGLVWMAENIAFKPKAAGAWRYRDDSMTAKRYGLLYDRATASNVCPPSWRLPTYDDLTALQNALGPTAGRKLRATQGWDDGGNGTDDIGFASLPAGSRYGGGAFANLGGFTAWWLDADFGPTESFALTLSARREDVYADRFNPTRGLSVRCVLTP